jgi:hypothetical protein
VGGRRRVSESGQTETSSGPRRKTTSTHAVKSLLQPSSAKKQSEPAIQKSLNVKSAGGVGSCYKYPRRCLHKRILCDFFLASLSVSACSSASLALTALPKQRSSPNNADTKGPRRSCNPAKEPQGSPRERAFARLQRDDGSVLGVRSAEQSPLRGRIVAQGIAPFPASARFIVRACMNETNIWTQSTAMERHAYKTCSSASTNFLKASGFLFVPETYRQRKQFRELNSIHDNDGFHHCGSSGSFP